MLGLSLISDNDAVALATLQRQWELGGDMNCAAGKKGGKVRRDVRASACTGNKADKSANRAREAAANLVLCAVQ